MIHWIALLVCLLGAPPDLSEHPGAQATPDLQVTIETPSPPAFRAVSPEEVKSAYERVLARRNAASSQPVSASVPTEPRGVPFVPLEFKPKSELEIAKPLERVKPLPEGPPEWDLQWKKQKSFLREEAELILKYTWEDQIVAFELRPENPESPSIRLLLNKPIKEKFSAAANLPYRLTISARAPGEFSFRVLYSAENQLFERGYSYELEFPRDIASEVADYLKKDQELRSNAGKAGKPVETVIHPTTPKEASN